MDHRTFRIVGIVAVMFIIVMVSYHVSVRNPSWMSREWLASAVQTAVYAAKGQVTPKKCPEFDFRNVSQTDPKLIEYVRKKVLLPPSVLPYYLNLPTTIDPSEIGQARYADNTYLHGLKDGFFLEAGAVDGEIASTTLYFERQLGWRGILIEPIPYTYETLVRRHRKAYSANVALAIEPRASEQTFGMKGNLGVESNFGKKGFTVKAIPLYTLLQALEVKVVDFLSLDIQSFEYKVLNTIPWDKIKFRLMCIEYNLIPKDGGSLDKFLISKGYKFLGTRGMDMWFGLPALLDPLNKTKKG